MSWRSRLAAAATAAAVSALSCGGGSTQPVAMGEASLIPRRAEAEPQRIAAASDLAERMTVPVTVDGHGPFPFVVDTGADRTVISRELADTLALRPDEPVRVNGVAGVDLTPTAHIDELAVGLRPTRDVSAPTLKETNLGAAGMLGIDSLRDQRIVMDFARNLLTVEPSRRERYGLDVIVVRAKSRYGQLVLVDASIGGAPLLVIVDSGAQNTIGNRALQQLVGGQWSERLPVEVISVSGRSAPAHFSTLPNVRIGGARIENLPIAFADLHTFEEFGMNDQPALLLGMDVLRHFDRVVVDFGRKEVRFQMPAEG